MIIKTVPSPAIDDLATVADWYLTVRCTNATCARLIAFQKTRYCDRNPDVRLAVIGKLSIECPHCKTLVRFQREQIERRHVVLTQ